MNEPKINYFDLIKSKNLIELDSKFAARLDGFTNIHEFYKGGSCKEDLIRVKVPLLMLSALDDPICFKECIPYVECLQNPNVILATTEFGGHLGWYEGWFPLQKSFAYSVTTEWCQSLSDHYYAASKAIKLE